MLQRVLEPEVMDTAAEAIGYDRMDHGHVNRVFIDDFLTSLFTAAHPPDGLWKIFDAGTGTALIPIELVNRGLKTAITAADLAEQMLRIAQQNVASNRMETSITLVLRDCKQLPDPDSSYDAVMSNSIVHHIPEPQFALTELWRILKPGGLFFVRDLFRPADLETLESIVQMYAADADEHQRGMFRDSLHAALTVDEVRSMTRQLGIADECVSATSDRHWTLCCYKK